MDKKSYIIPPENFEKLDYEQKMNTVFYYISTMHDNQAVESELNNRRLKKLEKRKLLDTGIAATTGAVGGFFAILAKWVLGKI